MEYTRYGGMESDAMVVWWVTVWCGMVSDAMVCDGVGMLWPICGALVLFNRSYAA